MLDLVLLCFEKHIVVVCLEPRLLQQQAQSRRLWHMNLLGAFELVSEYYSAPLRGLTERFGDQGGWSLGTSGEDGHADHLSLKEHRKTCVSICSARLTI